MAAKNSKNKFIAKNLKNDIRKIYKRLRLALYERANLIQKLKRSNLAEYKDQLKEKYTDQAAQADLGDDMADGIEEEDGADKEEAHNLDGTGTEDDDKDIPSDTEGKTLSIKKDLSQPPCRIPKSTSNESPSQTPPNKASSKTPPKKTLCAHIRCKLLAPCVSEQA